MLCQSVEFATFHSAPYTFLPPSEASGVGAAVASLLIYLLMAGVLVWRPQGLFPANG